MRISDWSSDVCSSDLRLGDAVEEVAGQVGLAPFAVAGVAVEAPERVPVPRLDLAAAERAQGHAGLGHLAPFLADRLAFARIQALQEGVEGFVAAVLPVDRKSTRLHYSN